MDDFEKKVEQLHEDYVAALRNGNEREATRIFEKSEEVKRSVGTSEPVEESGEDEEELIEIVADQYLDQQWNTVVAALDEDAEDLTDAQLRELKRTEEATSDRNSVTSKIEELLE